MKIKYYFSILSRSMFILIGGFFKEPLMFCIGLFGVFLFTQTTISFIREYSELFDPLKWLSEIFSAIISYTLFIKKNIAAWRKREILTPLVEKNLKNVKDKLLTFKIEFNWAKSDSKKIVNMIFSQWIKTEQFKYIEADFVDAIDTIILAKLKLSPGKQIFIKYIAYELFTLSRSKFISELAYTDFTKGSATNEFVSLFYSYINKGWPAPQKAIQN